jgi:hypothetical protein
MRPRKLPQRSNSCEDVHGQALAVLPASPIRFPLVPIYPTPWGNETNSSARCIVAYIVKLNVHVFDNLIRAAGFMEDFLPSEDGLLNRWTESCNSLAETVECSRQG